MLPVEILVEIFDVYILSAIYEERYSYSWIRITHVCHRWRVVAMTAPLLWSRIYFDNVVKHNPANDLEKDPSGLNTCVPEMLARSRNTLLDVYICFYYSRSTPRPSETWSIYQTLISSLSRAHTFTIIRHDYRPEDDTWLQDHIPSKAPHLVSLALSGRNLPALFAQCDMPVLRELHVSPAKDAWSTSCIFQGPLTRLRLYEIEDNDFSALLSTLKALPSLEELTIWGDCPEWSAAKTYPDLLDSVSLPRLKSLELVFEDSNSWLALYQRLRLPPTTMFTLHVYVVHMNTTVLRCDQFAPTFLSMLESFTAHSGRRIRGVAYRPTSDALRTSTGVELYTTDILDWRRTPSSEDLDSVSYSTPLHLRPQFHLKLECDHALSPCPPIFLQFLHALPLSETTWLCIGDIEDESGGYPGPCEEELRTLIEAKMPALTTVCLGGGQTAEMVAALLSRTDDPEEGKFLIPHLTTLYLYNASFRFPEARAEEDPSELKDDLMKILVDRANADAYIQRLVLLECSGLWEQDLVDMRETMGRTDWILEWDGVDAFDALLVNPSYL
ncbi:hypothetical protein EIP91_005465 [Steccherinum ochraceum]|uniref:F-box domain-containing protein n=1 Tax=Steccherinum ochraceum TaxID=92696 RepID=A0A4R0RZ58_9APHY|nr:hypothetical protein EIP91_005465 [Steccherinum ochraceum]